MARICFFNARRSWGGGEKWHCETARHLAAQGHEVVVVAHPHGKLIRKVRAAGVGCVPLPVSNLSFLNPLKAARVVHLLKNRAVQTLVLNGSAEAKLGAPAARLAGVRAVVYRRGLGVPVRNTLLNRWIYGTCITHFLTNSEATARELFKHLALEDARVRTIYNGVDLPDLSEDPPAWKAGPGKLILGTAGRLGQEKGHGYLLDLAVRLRERGRGFRLCIAGEGRQRPVLERRIQELGLEAEVELVGFVADMGAFLQQLDIFLMPSLWEGFGYAVVEAMAAGVPVVAFGVGSIPEIVENGVTGFLVPVKDVASLSDRVELLAADPDLRRRMGQKARETVQKRFARSEQLAKLEAYLCREVLEPGEDRP
ncbi:MAG: glycosyltransferase [Desulfohalobiaceae bacterium]